MKLIKHAVVEGILLCETGCRIGGIESGFEIAGIDNPIIRNPLDGLPYIPGSSIKGKIRSLIEQKYGKITDVGGPCECGGYECFVCNLFGCGKPRNTKAPTRLIFRDSFMTADGKKQVGEVLKDFAEVKTEVRINRKTSTSADPRDNYRIPAGTKFQIEFSIRVFEDDRKYWDVWRQKLAEGFELLEADYLGGSGTRGYGQVKVFSAEGKPMAEYLKSLSV